MPVAERLSQTGCFDAVGQPVAALVPYTLRAPLWSDGADKRRFMALPDGSSAGIDPSGDLRFPVGTVLVKDIVPGSGSPFYSFDFWLTNVNGTLFFEAYDGTYGTELWKSDGTEAGTVLVKDINPGAVSSDPSGLTNVNGTLFFAADDGSHRHALWRSDGTPAGTWGLDRST